jgi:dTDP-4-dehydrorhamnose 3,5-epimerase
MSFQIESIHLGEIKVIAPPVHGDDRGFFMEVYRADRFRELGLPWEFLQDNHSRSVRGVLRGLHFQWDPPMGKLMRVIRGAAFLVAVDIRKGSPTIGQWFGMEVSAENKKQIWAPFNFARGFCALTDDCEVQYKCTCVYNPKAESGINVADPQIGIRWPIDPAAALLSDKDRKAQSLAEWLQSPLSEHLNYNAGSPGANQTSGSSGGAR